MDVVVGVEQRGATTVVRASGDLDVATAPRLREQVIRIVAEGQRDIILDLDAVDFVDSTGLGVIVGLLKRTRTLGGDLRLVSTRPALQRILELTALDRALPLAASVDEALARPGRTEG
ncbi:MAG: STAS domain-containing protein [Acidimicrobiales bacterium]